MHSQLLHTIPTPPEAIEGGINLDLGIGNSSCGVVKEALFSPSQFHELLSQILVYNWIISGFMNRNCDRGVNMDLDSGRCRRTDGRKWRCSRSVVPGQKYCERHMHRGRQGSRKHVEPSANFNANKPLDDNRAPMIPSLDRRIDVSDKGREGNPAIVNSGSNKSQDAFVADGIVKEVSNSDHGSHATTSTFTNSINNRECTDAKKTGFGNTNCTKISRRKQSVTKNNHHGFVSPGFGLSPKSVLHCGAGKVEPNLESKSVTETEQPRCRRTDGKKWQCRRDSVPGQKYCEAHMHRGAKRVMLNPESASNVPTTSTNIAGQHSINLNSIPASPQHTPDNNSTSSTSDATTVTDENISSCIKSISRRC